MQLYDSKLGHRWLASIGDGHVPLSTKLQVEIYWDFLLKPYERNTGCLRIRNLTQGMRLVYDAHTTSDDTIRQSWGKKLNDIFPFDSPRYIWIEANSIKTPFILCTSTRPYFCLIIQVTGVICDDVDFKMPQTMSKYQHSDVFIQQRLI